MNTVISDGWLTHCWLVSWLCVLGTGGGIKYRGQVSLCKSTFFSLKMRLSTHYWTKVYIPQHYYWWDFLLPCPLCPAFLWVTGTAHQCFLYLLEEDSDGLVSSICWLQRILYSSPFWVGLNPLSSMLCFSCISMCAEHYFHSALPLLNCPHECFDRSRKRLWGFLEDRVWLGAWEWCHYRSGNCISVAEVQVCRNQSLLLLLSTHQGYDCNLPYVT